MTWPVRAQGSLRLSREIDVFGVLRTVLSNPQLVKTTRLMVARTPERRATTAGDDADVHVSPPHPTRTRALADHMQLVVTFKIDLSASGCTSTTQPRS